MVQANSVSWKPAVIAQFGVLFVYFEHIDLTHPTNSDTGKHSLARSSCTSCH